MTPAPAVDRARWLGFRWSRHGLGAARPVGARTDLLLLGVQDGRRDGAAHSLAARGAGDDGTVLVYSVRGAPHRHARNRLGTVRAAVAPLDTDTGGPERVSALREIADALCRVVTGPETKGEISTALTARVAHRATWCARCGADHVPDLDFRIAATLAGLVLVPGPGTVLEPGPPTPAESTVDARTALLDAWFRFDGPVARATVTDWFGGDPAAIGPLWKAGSGSRVTVRVDDRRCEVPGALLDDLRAAPVAEGVALVPPHDAWLRRVDRALLVPDRARRSRVWQAVSAPGALLAGGEVAGTWRHRREGTLVEPFEELPRTVVDAVVAEAERVTGSARVEVHARP
ncbi:winged helix DNA-binding domain-containing protein [Pseudonocardia sp. C8]|uniref:crosslink repair DNA glycosylase YcaQ family protein n=1 Tax=Pseudonocardia sp. C8 TaxID=2762759 RepID=UPI001642E493|nr:winged helix DNA-binding domain-containing protein [Pseudonocardia sp. C8]